MMPGWMWGKVSPIHNSNQGGEPLRTRKTRKPIVGYRTWLITAGALRSIHINYLWQVDNTAECRAGGHHDDPAPSLSCACGLYAQTPNYPLGEWLKITAGRVRGSGTVALSGRVIRCEFGYKAEHARLQSPVIIEADCHKTTLTHPCFNAASLVHPGETPYAYCAEHLPDDPDLIPVSGWMTGLCRTLEDAYPGIEFLSELAEW